MIDPYNFKSFLQNASRVRFYENVVPAGHFREFERRWFGPELILNVVIVRPIHDWLWALMFCRGPPRRLHRNPWRRLVA